MNIAEKEIIINKLEILPEKMVEKVNLYIDYLIHDLSEEKTDLTEEGFEDYLLNLEKYEDMLKEEKIKWEV